MLVNCPKCGFSQPQDRFCAKCGVDMSSFRPASPSIGKRLLGSPFFHLSIILLLALLIVYFIRTQPQDFGFSKTPSAKAGPFVIEKHDDEKPPARGFMPDQPPPTLPETNSPTTTVAALMAKAPEPEENKSRSIKAKITYAEVDRNILEALKQESISSGQYSELGDFKAGAIPEIGKKISKEMGIGILQKTEKQFDSANPTQQWFLGHKYEGDFEIGFTTALSLRANEDGTLHGELEILRSLKESREGAPVKRAYPITTFDIPSSSGWMVTMNLPRQIDQDEGEGLAPEGILRLFRSARFRAGTSEFTLFIEFDTPATNSAGRTRNESRD